MSDDQYGTDSDIDDIADYATSLGTLLSRKAAETGTRFAVSVEANPPSENEPNATASRTVIIIGSKPFVAAERLALEKQGCTCKSTGENTAKCECA